MVILVSSDDVEFEVDREVIERSVLIRNMLEDLGERDEEIPLKNISSEVLDKVLVYCEYYRGEPLDSDDQGETRDTSRWDQAFITADQEMLFDIILAANYLDIQSLLKIGCQTVANMIKGKPPEQIRRLFGIDEAFTPEEEAQIMKEHKWAQDQ